MKKTSKIEITIECEKDKCGHKCPYLEEFLSYTGSTAWACHLYLNGIRHMNRLPECKEGFGE